MPRFPAAPGGPSCCQRTDTSPARAVPGELGHHAADGLAARHVAQLVQSPRGLRDAYGTDAASPGRRPGSALKRTMLSSLPRSASSCRKHTKPASTPAGAVAATAESRNCSPRGRFRVYGIILVDIETRRPVDMIPERSAESFRACHRQAVQVEVHPHRSGRPAAPHRRPRQDLAPHPGGLTYPDELTGETT